MFKKIFFSFAIVCALMPSVVRANSQVTFNYQGRVKVQGQPYSGTGLFKFAVLNTSSTAYLWTNDGTETFGIEPAASVSLPVADGVFNVLMGDTTMMQPISPTIFQSRTPLKLRVWFNDGSHGFQQLVPDHNLVDLSLTTVETGNQDFTIYVNGTTGNDVNNGLTPSKAKKTIQAAVDILPDRLNCNVTISIANGTYHEEVVLYGLAVKPGKTLLLQGDTAWAPSAVTEPAVKISGSDNDSISSRLRPSALHAVQCSGVSFTGIAFKFATGHGLFLENGSYTVSKCQGIANGLAGLMADTQSQANVTYFYGLDNSQTGVYLANNSRVNFTHVQALRNTQYGMRMLNQSNSSIYGSCQVSNNGLGIQLRDLSMCSFAGGLSGGITSNTTRAFEVVSGSIVLYSQSNFSFTGNPGGFSSLVWGGQTYPVD